MPKKSKNSSVLKQPAVGGESALLSHALGAKAWLQRARDRFIAATGGSAYGGISTKDGHKKPVDAAQKDMYAPSRRAFAKAQEKAVKFGDKDGYRYIKDMIRCSIQYEDAGEIIRALQGLFHSTYFKVVEAKDHVDHSKPGFYCDLNLIVVCPENHHLCEVQLHFKAMLKAKNSGGHKFYGVYRTADATLKSKSPAEVRKTLKPSHSQGSYGGPTSYNKEAARKKRALMNRYSAKKSMEKVYGGVKNSIDTDSNKQDLLNEVRRLQTIANNNAKTYLEEISKPELLKQIKRKLGFATSRQFGGRLNSKRVGQHLAHVTASNNDQFDVDFDSI